MFCRSPCGSAGGDKTQGKPIRRKVIVGAMARRVVRAVADAGRTRAAEGNTRRETEGARVTWMSRCAY